MVGGLLVVYAGKLAVLPSYGLTLVPLVAGKPIIAPVPAIGGGKVELPTIRLPGVAVDRCFFIGGAVGTLGDADDGGGGCFVDDMVVVFYQ